MDGILSHETALEVLRRRDLRGRVARGERPAIEAPPLAPRRDELLARIEGSPVLRGISLPLDLLVSSDGGRVRTALSRAHLQRAPLPAGSVVRLAEGVFCTAPEQLAVQMAPRLTMLELAVLLSELMGTYSIDADLEDGMSQRLVPLMTREGLLAHLDALGSRPGVLRVRRAAAMACVGSGSPRETKLSMRFGLKPAHGGHHLNVLSMNEPLEVRRIIGSMRAGVRKPDLLIGGPEGRIVAVEYLGRHHDEPARLVQDANRTNELKAIGVSEYVIRREQYADLDYMDGIADAIRRELGLPRIGLAPDERERRRVRRAELFEELERIDGTHWDGRARERLRAAGAPEPAEADGWDVVPLSAYGLG